MNDNQLFLIAPKSYIDSMGEAAREYFSRPIPVTKVRTDNNGLVWVTDEVKGHTYPSVPANLHLYKHIHWKIQRTMVA